MVGRVLEMAGNVTGKSSTKAKGKGARARGSAKSAKGRARRTARR